MFEVLLVRAAQKDLKGLSGEVFYRIIPHINSLAENPHSTGYRKIVGSTNDWRIRVGDYRIVYEIDDVNRKVIVFRVKHRKEAY